MKLTLTSVCLIFFISLLNTNLSYAQTEDRPTWLNAYFGHQEYDGDLGNELLEFSVGNEWAGGIGVNQYVGRHFDLELSLMYGKLDFQNGADVNNNLKRNSGFEKFFVNGNALIRFKLLKESSYVRPFIATGIGITPFFGGSVNGRPGGDKIDDVTTVQIPLRAGVDIKLTDQINMTLNSTYNRTFADGIDGFGNNKDIDAVGHDDFLIHSIGFKFSLFQKNQDQDSDGVEDKVDDCPQTSGVASLGGCPDRDGDNIIDADDRCPAQAGNSSLGGCPDADEDGIEDNQDACPEVAGEADNKGCPDSDGDGIIDKGDECPNLEGPAKFNGCPDSDNDGLKDTVDECPEEAGPKDNKGCQPPKEVKEEIKRAVAVIINNLLFSSGSSNIDRTSYDDLNRMANIMREDNELMLTIEGYTDNVGDKDLNLRLSQARADAVLQYLVGQGISPDRLTAVGYGEINPIASNNTVEGRIRNRRVELNLYYLDN